MVSDRVHRQPRLGAVLCTYRRPGELAEMLRALRSQTKAIDRLVVVDNAGDPEVERLCRESLVECQAEYVASADNIGPAGAFRTGLSLIQSGMDDDDLVVLLDDDDPPQNPDTLEQLYRAACSLGADPAFAGVGGRGGRLLCGRITRVPEPGGPRAQRCDHLHGGFQPIYRVAACRDVAPFEPDFFWGFEELEFGRRLVAAGWKLYAWSPVEESSPRPPKRAGGAFHLRSPTWRDYYRHRNLLVVLIRERDWCGVVFTVLGRLVAKPLLFLLIRPSVAIANLRINGRAMADSVRRPLPDRRDLVGR